ncbi:hypothetical protein AB0L70_09335 [Kribbella sp. NPDC051952]|uniref:hypothetical protein n=1 Tax=Kribbella sp. NPDC051952 TaxID=3154851 RepID=UPI00342C16B6
MSPQPVNFGGIGDIDMYPDDTFRASQQIYQAGGLFGSKWPGLLKAIDDDEQVVSTGFDELSVAYRAAYNAYKEVVPKQAAEVAPKLYKTADAGRRGVVEYLQLSEQDQPAYMRALE